MANPFQEGLSGLLNQIKKDTGLWEMLIPAGLIQFGNGPVGDHDPVCFDTSKRYKDGDYRIVKLDHEEILCNYRHREVAESAPSFKELVIKTIEKVKS